MTPGAGRHHTAVGGIPPFVGDPRVRCGPTTAEQFFYEPGERGPSRELRDRIAKAICYNCPLRSECAEWAAGVPEEFGVWGATTPAERRAEARRRDLVLRLKASA